MSRIGALTAIAVLFAPACQSSSATSPADASNVGEADGTFTGDATPDVQPTSCTAPSDCIHFPSGPAIACCIGRACVYGQATEADSCVDASAQTIMASSYDQSCQKDSDCVAIEEGDFCQPGANNGCTNAAINRTALAQYQADLANTTAGVCYGLAGCPVEPVPCCRNGTCQANGQCFVTVQADAATEASTDAGHSADAADADVESGAGRVPVHHRPSAAQCSTPAPAGDCAGPYPDGGGCASDSDCAEAGTNGRCIHPGGGPAAPCSCTYDKCSSDTNCPGGQTCACHGAPYTDGAGNACVKGNCRVDSDCGAEGYCSPSSDTSICGDSLAGYYCHTAADLCIDDSDCPTSATVVGSPGCVYSTTDSRWECLVVPVCL